MKWRIVMTKIFICSFLICFSMVTFQQDVYAGCKKGDANMDGDIDHADLYEMKQIMRIGNACDMVIDCADYDGDGSVTVFDIRSVLGEIISNCEPGDANTSGHLTSSDICKVEEMISDNKYSKCADCNKDGILTPADVTCIRNKMNNS